MARHGVGPGGLLGLSPILLAVVVVGSVTLVSVACTTLVILCGKEAPEGLVAIGSAGVGAMAGLLARTTLER